MELLKDTFQIAITFSKRTITNIPEFSDDLKNHHHEEADTLLVLHAIDVARRNPFDESDEAILIALMNLGNGEQLPSLVTLEDLSCFVVNTYAANINANIATLEQLRWYLFSKCQKDAASNYTTYTTYSLVLLSSKFFVLILSACGTETFSCDTSTTAHT